MFLFPTDAAPQFLYKLTPKFILRQSDQETLGPILFDKQSELSWGISSSIDDIRILIIGLELACNGG